MHYPNQGANLLLKWNILSQTRNFNNIYYFIRSTKTSSPTNFSGATILPPIGKSFMFIETSSYNHGANAFVSWERTGIIQITNITFYYNRFSILTNDALKSMGRFRIQILLEDITWSTIYTIEKNTNYNDTSTDWTLLNLDFTVENYGIKLVYDQIDKPICVSQIYQSLFLCIKNSYKYKYNCIYSSVIIVCMLLYKYSNKCMYTQI